jgi:hypothetical protein
METLPNELVLHIVKYLPITSAEFETMSLIRFFMVVDKILRDMYNADDSVEDLWLQHFKIIEVDQTLIVRLKIKKIKADN